MDFAKELYLGTLNDASLNLESYMNYINFNQVDIGLEDGYSIPRRFYKHAKLCISKDGIEIKFDTVIKMIESQYKLDEILDKDILQKSKDIQKVKTYKDLEEQYPELASLYQKWRSEGIKRYPTSVEKVEKKYSHFEKTKKTIYSRIAKGVTEEKMANYKMALEDIDRQIPISKAEAINNELIRLFICEIVFEYKLYLTYKENPKSRLNKNNTHLVTPERVRCYIAKSLYDKATDEKATESIQKTAYKYLKDFIDHVPGNEKSYSQLESEGISQMIDNIITFVNDYEERKGQGLK